MTIGDEGLPAKKVEIKPRSAVGLITGVTKTTLEPKGNATRAQAATIFWRYCQ